MAEENSKSPKSPNKELSDSDTSERSRLILALELQKKRDIMGLYMAQH